MLLDNLPIAFAEFLKAEGIDPSLIQPSTRRYVRIKPTSNLTLEDLKIQLHPETEEVSWIPNMFSIPAQNKINQNKLYKEGQLYGIDLASAAVVHAMQINNNDYKVLEVCCAPGAKLTYISDLMRTYGPGRRLFGIDINENRLNIARSLVNKYGHSAMVTLILGDGTTYQGEHDFDKILVDAECTHEGSIKHLQKFQSTLHEETNSNQLLQKKKLKQLKQSQKQLKKNHSNLYLQEQQKPNDWSSADFMDRVLDPKKLENITLLQQRLLKNSSTLLKQGGIIIYSTCSFSRRQNEDIIEKFLMEQENTFELIEVFDSEVPCKNGLLGKTVRFDPITSNCGGMFIAKMKKL